MTRETKFGLLLVLTLTTTFGFLVWKRLHQPKDLVATTQTEQTEEIPGGEGETPPEASVGSLDDRAATFTPLAAIPSEKTPPRRPATPIEPATDARTRGDDLFPAHTPAIKTVRSKPKLPVEPRSTGLLRCAKRFVRSCRNGNAHGVDGIRSLFRGDPRRDIGPRDGSFRTDGSLRGTVRADHNTRVDSVHGTRPVRGGDARHCADRTDSRKSKPVRSPRTNPIRLAARPSKCRRVNHR